MDISVLSDNAKFFLYASESESGKDSSEVEVKLSLLRRDSVSVPIVYLGVTTSSIIALSLIHI